MTAQGDLSALVGSRICHDLVNPLGAIGNGVELLELTGMARTPEMALLSDSITAAQARLRFFGIAYGPADAGLALTRTEIAGILADLSRSGRLSFAWDAEGDVKRGQAKAILLLLQCLESAMPYGGEIRVQHPANAWEITAESRRFNVDPTLWAALQARVDPPVTAAQVQFALLPVALAALGRSLAVTLAPDRIVARF